MNDPLAVKVRIRNSEGRYLTGGGSNSGFSDDASKAIIFDYLRHQVAEQLEEIRRTRGILLEAVPVDPIEVYETCDHCGRLASPLDIFFDGNRLLCFECLADASALVEPSMPRTAPASQRFAAKGSPQ